MRAEFPDADDGPFEPIPILRYSTQDLPPDERYRAWYLRDWPRITPIFRTEPAEPFNTRWESAQLGDIIFIHTTITGMRWERTTQDIRVSDFDPVVVNMMIEGEAHGDMDGRAFHERAGDFHFHDLARPSLHSSTGSRTWSLVLPRPVAEQAFAPLHDLHGLVISGTAASALFALAEHVHAILPRLEAAEGARLGRVFLDLLGVALMGRRASEPVRLGADAVLRRRAAEEIERRLGGEVTIPDLLRLLGVGRNRLFAVFRADGGVQAYVMSQRLERAKAALADLERAEGINNLALRLGFGAASHFSRSFRKRYGMTPSEYRKLLMTGPAEVAAGR